MNSVLQSLAWHLFLHSSLTNFLAFLLPFPYFFLYLQVSCYFPLSFIWLFHYFTSWVFDFELYCPSPARLHIVLLNNQISRKFIHWLTSQLIQMRMLRMLSYWFEFPSQSWATTQFWFHIELSNNSEQLSTIIKEKLNRSPIIYQNFTPDHTRLSRKFITKTKSEI